MTQNIGIIEGYRPRYLCVLAGDHVYKQDYSQLIQQHVEQNADATVGCIEIPSTEASAFGIVQVNDRNRVVGFTEKPAVSHLVPGHPRQSLASMGTYVFNTDSLFELLHEDSQNPNSSHDLCRDIIPHLVKHGNVVAHPFSRSCIRNKLTANSYWRDVSTIDAFWQANLDLTDFLPELDIYDRGWPIWTYSELTPPAKFIHNEEGRRGNAISSMVSGGCIISGAWLERCLLFTGVHAHSYSNLTGVVAMPHVRIGRNARLHNVIVDSGVHIPEGLVVGEDPALDAHRFQRTEQGVCLITSSMIKQLTTC